MNNTVDTRGGSPPVPTSQPTSTVSFGQTTLPITYPRSKSRTGNSKEEKNSTLLSITFTSFLEKSLFEIPDLKFVKDFTELLKVVYKIVQFLLVGDYS